MADVRKALGGEQKIAGMKGAVAARRLSPRDVGTGRAAAA